MTPVSGLEKYLKKLIGRKDVEDALQRLDQLTQEEARMAAVEVLRITRGIDGRVQGVDHKVGSVITGELFPELAFTSIRSVLSMETGAAIQHVSNQVNDQNRELYSNVITVVYKSSNFLTGNELRKDLRKWIAPPDPSVNFNTASDAHHEGTAAWCTKGNTVADWKISGSLLWIHGKRTYLVAGQVSLPTNDILVLKLALERVSLGTISPIELPSNELI